MKILIVEDDAFFRNFYMTKLKDTGFEVFAAVDGEEGMSKARQFKPDVILLDIVMPKKDGFAVLQELSKDALLMNTPVLVFSSLNQKEDLEKIKKIGAKGYVSKNVQDFDSLLSKIFEVTKSSVPTQ